MTYNVELLPAQRKFIELPDGHSDRDISLYQGGFGSGKTWCGSLLGIMLAVKYPGIKGLVGAATYALVSKTTLEQYKEHLANLNLKYTFNEKKQLMIFPNGSTISFMHFENPEALKSLTVGFIEIEEMSDIPEETFNMLLGRLRQTKRPEWGDGFVYRLFGHTNPQASKGWIYEYFKKNPRKDYRRVIAPTTDNKHLPQSFIDGMREAYSDEYYYINVLGQDDDSQSNLACKGFNADSQVTNSIKIDSKYPIHLTCDFNIDPMCWYICQDYGDMTYVLYEIVQENTTTDATACIVCDLLKHYKQHPIIINGDASGQSRTTKGVDYMYLRNRLVNEGFSNIRLEVMAKNPSIEWRMSCFNNRLKAPDGTHKILIHPQCRWLIYNIENVELKAGTNKPKIPGSREIQRNSKAKYLIHPIDAVSYLVSFYHPVQDESPFQQFKETDIGTDVFGGKYDKRLI